MPFSCSLALATARSAWLRPRPIDHPEAPAFVYGARAALSSPGSRSLRRSAPPSCAPELGTCHQDGRERVSLRFPAFSSRGRGAGLGGPYGGSQGLLMLSPSFVAADVARGGAPSFSPGRKSARIRAWRRRHRLLQSSSSPCLDQPRGIDRDLQPRH